MIEFQLILAMQYQENHASQVSDLQIHVVFRYFINIAKQI